jgi:hypothetical protein
VSVAWAPPTIASIVEGDGEALALPRLLHRIATERGVPVLLTPPPKRLSRGKITVAGGIERAVEAEALRVPGKGGVLVLLDADDDCPADYGPRLRIRASREPRRPACPTWRPWRVLAPLTAAFDLTMAREHADSFDKLYREVSRLLGVGEGD